MENKNADCDAEFISTLPLEQWPFPTYLSKYQGIWLPNHFVAGAINVQRHFQAHPTDIIVASYPKCGTTWLKALVFATMTRTHHSLASHPLRHLNPHECIPILEQVSDCQHLNDMSAMIAPRVLGTHLPFHMLPDSIKYTSGCRLVYICREPKDALLSLCHFLYKPTVDAKADTLSQKDAFNNFLDKYCNGFAGYGGIWDHVLGYWNESLRAPDKLLILNYEDILEAPLDNLMKLAEFIGCPFSEDETNRLMPQDIIKLCSFDSLKNIALQHSQLIGIPNHKTEAFYRKGSVGDWKNQMISPEIVHKLDQITRNKLSGIAITLGWLGTETTSYAFDKLVNDVIQCEMSYIVSPHIY